MNEVLWTDVAPRDGLQNIADTISTEAKIRLVRGLLDAGVPRVEATSFVSPSWVPQLADAPAVLAGLQGELARLRVLIPNLRGLELALAHGVRNVLVTIAATDSFNRRNVNRSVERVARRDLAHRRARRRARMHRRRRRFGEFRMSIRGKGCAGAGRRAVRGPGCARCRGGGCRRHDRRGNPCRCHRDVRARCRRRADRSAVVARARHARARRCQRDRRIRRRRSPLRRIGRWRRWLPLRAALHRQRLHRGRAAGAARTRSRHRHRPRRDVRGRGDARVRSPPRPSRQALSRRNLERRPQEAVAETSVG